MRTHEWINFILEAVKLHFMNYSFSMRTHEWINFILKAVKLHFINYSFS